MSWKFVYAGSYVQCGQHKYHIFGSRDADAEEAVRGMTAGGAYFDEMTLMNQGFIAMCITRCSLPRAKLVGSMNPSYPMHFVKLDYIDRAAELSGTHMEYGFDDNPVLDPHYVESLRRTLTGSDYDRMFLGKWSASSGLVYPEVQTYNEQADTSSSFERSHQGVRNTVAVDYSTSGITSFLLCRKDRKGNSFVSSEWYHDGSGMASGRQLTDTDLVDALSTFVSKNGLDPAHVQVLPDPSASSFKVEARRAGWNVQSADNDVPNGIRITGAALKHGRIVVSTGCRKLLKEIGTYMWDQKACERGEDKPLKTKIHHGVDALRYYAMKNYRSLLRTGPIATPIGW